MYMCTDCSFKAKQAPTSNVEVHACDGCKELRACFIYTTTKSLNESKNSWVIISPAKEPGELRSFSDHNDPEVIAIDMQLVRDKYLIKFDRAAANARENLVELLNISDPRRIQNVAIEIRANTV